MTIRALAKKYGAKVSSDRGPESVSVAFAFDSGYLTLFKTCIISMMHTSNFLDSPIVIYTDDPDVLDDPVVTACADRVVLVSGARKERLQALAQNNVQRPERATWNRGTFLKWSVFERHDSDVVVFLDVDIIFLERVDRDLLALAKYPFTAVPQFRKELLREKDKIQNSPAEQKRLLIEVIEGQFWGLMQTNINSGMMVLKDKVITNEFFDEITGFASERRAVNEQHHFSKFFMEHPNELDMISARFNFQENYLSGLSWDDQKEILDRASVLHYTGSPKPWATWPKHEFRPTTALWHWYRSLAENVLGEDFHGSA